MDVLTSRSTTATVRSTRDSCHRRLTYSNRDPNICMYTDSNLYLYSYVYRHLLTSLSTTATVLSTLDSCQRRFTYSNRYIHICMYIYSISIYLAMSTAIHKHCRDLLASRSTPATLLSTLDSCQRRFTYSNGYIHICMYIYSISIYLAMSTAIHKHCRDLLASLSTTARVLSTLDSCQRRFSTPVYIYISVCIPSLSLSI